MDGFVHETHAQRVRFGAGAFARAAEEVERLGARRLLIVASPSNRERAEELAAALAPREARVIGDARQHVPFEQAEAARALAREAGAEAAVAVGGGTPIGLAKAVALTENLPIVAVPTSYSGSEMTGIVGITRNGVKKTVGGPFVRPRAVLYDPALTLGLPPRVTAASGMNAIAHAVEALYAAAATPLASLTAEAGLAALAEGLPAAVKAPSDAEARTRALYGAWLAGAALGATGIALHHRLCHVLGGTYGLDHGEANAVVMPHAVHYNAPAAPGAIARAARALGAADGGTDAEAAALAAPFLFDFVAGMGAPTSLAELGLERAALGDAAALAAAHVTENPRPVTRESMRALLEDAWSGRRPPSA